MSDGATTTPQAPALPLMPCVEPHMAVPHAAVLGEARRFFYLGTPLGLAAFRAYVATYDFGPIKPDQVVLHNTANPDASWASVGESSHTHWDRDEATLSTAQIQDKRQIQLDSIRNYYAALGWDRGPHLFIDERWIWLFTPMREIGIHAAEGNSYHDDLGHLHYTIGIEVVGWFGRNPWHPQQAALLRGAVQALRDTLRTFQITYTSAPPYHPAAHQGTIAFHRDYNKPACPGAAITPQYAIGELRLLAKPGAGRYVARHDQAIFESPAPDGKIALGDTARLMEGIPVEVDEVAHEGWAHLSSGLGFVPVGILERIS